MNLQAAVLLLALVTTAEGAPSLRFVSVGDWGIGSVAEEKNPGERAASEAVAYAMAADVAAEGAAFVLALGDNFYQDGVANATDGLWERAWRGLWLAKRGGALAGRPWYAILGNHDYHQGLDAALSQTRRMTETDDDEWHMPSTAPYVVTATLDDGVAPRTNQMPRRLVCSM